MGAGPVALFNAPSPKKEENIIYIYIYQGPQKVQSAPKWQVCPVYNTRGHSGKQTNDRSEMSEGNSLRSMCIPPRCALLSCPSSGLPRPRNAPERSGTLRPGARRFLKGRGVTWSSQHCTHVSGELGSGGSDAGFSSRRCLLSRSICGECPWSGGWNWFDPFLLFTFSLSNRRKRRGQERQDRRTPRVL